MPDKDYEIRKQIVRYVIYLLIVLSLTALAFYLSLRGNIYQIGETLKTANVWYLVAIFGIIIACILCRSIAIFSFARLFDKSYFFHRAIAIDQVGTLYRMVTPAGVGGHIMETYTFHKQGIKLPHALSIIAMYTFVYQIVLIFYGVITLIVKGNLISQIGYIPISFSGYSSVNVPLWLLITIGFTFNVLSIGFVFLISYWNGFFRFVRGPIVKLFHKVRLVKDLDKSQAYLDDVVVNFRNNLKTLLKNLPVFAISFVAFFAYITLSYSTPYFCGLALSNTSAYANFWDSVLLSNFHQMVTCVIPIPGSSVVSELFFINLFYPASGPQFYSSMEIAKASLLLWRSLMFIIPLFIACIYTVSYRPRKQKHEDQENQIVKE